MADKTLATFRIDSEEWESFKNLASSESSNASALLTEFVRWYLAGNRFNTPTSHTPTHLDTSLEQRIDNIEQRLDKVTTNNLDNIDEFIDKRIEDNLATRLDKLQSQLEELRGKSKAR
ncbi:MULTISPECIES: hypothetical protein [Nostocaceae]|uniref:hypothetical protein n=1 Tax=Nostocaceae TaxID=1162 RepID=UPI00000B5383|nr:MULTISPECIES: hypothetical protein [Nostocaceae]AII99673.1 hyp1 [Broad host range vector vector pCVD051]AII99677.1 hyp1 [Broad host range vector vector pCVD052]QGX42293.1 hypothetical protein [Expression vector pDU1]AAM76171.1 Orf6 [Nostoc sp. PCC 7524]AFY51376.1 hypothetical protein Nos7524_5689 [Nostoc sp. PCC 7524]